MSQDPFPQQDWTTQVFPAPARAQESGLKPLKALQRIGYNPNQDVRGSTLTSGVRWVEPGAMFVPVSAAERRDLLAGAFPPAREPTTAEIAAFG